MAKSLLVVESPSKARTIAKYLGNEFSVIATSGHIKNLPEFKLGINVENKFEPEYVIIEGKSKIIKELKEYAKKTEKIYIATDPDREGEAIANHVAEAISNSKKLEIFRVLFNEITKDAVLEGIKNPHSINTNLVEAQKARRILDRFVGFMVSPFLWKIIFKGLSAGRVQSVALRLLSERETEIQKFVAEEYWKIFAELKPENFDSFSAVLFKIGNREIKIRNKEDADKILKKAEKSNYVVADISKKELKRQPYPPFITSTLQQEAVKRFGMGTRKVMSIAQKLYEGIELGDEGNVGLVTYIRTDSVRVNENAVNSVRKYIEKEYGKDMLNPSIRKYKNKKRSQDAHEAIRPTYFDKPPKSVQQYLSRDEFKIYELIWNRFAASQMKDAVFTQFSCDIKADEYLFRCTDSILKFSGFLTIFSDFNEEKNSENKKKNIPVNLKKGDILKLLKIEGKQNFTQPPSRYTESSLVKELDAKGIGRPSTYAVIISTLFDRKYVSKENKSLIPTELGMDVNKILVNNLSELFNVKFTAQMEDKLDLIESGDREAYDVIKEFYEPFNESIGKLNKKRSEIKKMIEEVTEIKCDKCGSPMLIKWSKNGKFYACSSFPKCKNTKPINEPEAPKETEYKCEKCGSKMLVKKGRYGEFLACSNYPTCKNTKPVPVAKCPNKGCNGDIVLRRGKKGGFYGCTNYPECNFISRFRIVNKECENCKSNYLEIRGNRTGSSYFYCPKCKSRFKM